MSRDGKRVSLSPEQILYFRARRQHLAGPGAPDARTVAKAVLGVQSQQWNPSLWGLCLRLKNRCGSGALGAEILGPQRSLVRTWGQRDTIHLYDPRTHWADIVAARDLWSPMGRRGGMPPARVVMAAAARLGSSERPLCRSDLFDLIPDEFLDEIDARVGDRRARLRFAAGRVLWRLNQMGSACLAEKIGAEQTHAARPAWFPELAWPRENPDPLAAAVRLAADYLRSYGPATPQDLAHFFGARIAEARRWLEDLSGQGALLQVECGHRLDLFALAEDLPDLRAKVPRGIREWPVRLLPLWDGLLMGHADKSWTVPETLERTRVWRKAAYVSATVLARGRVVAAWSHNVGKDGLELAVAPMSGWSSKAHLGGVRREARALARHLGCGAVSVKVSG